MGTQGSLVRRYFECTAFVLLWLAAEFHLGLTPLQSQFLGIPLIALFQIFVARRTIPQLWAFDATTFRLTRRALGIAAALALGCGALLWLGSGTPAPGLGNRWAIGAMAAVASIPAGFALSQQRVHALRRVFGWVIAAAIVRVAWHAVMAPPHANGVMIPPERALGFFTLLLCKLVILFLFDEVAFRGALDPHLAGAAKGRLHAVCSAVFLSMLWAVWHLRAYNPRVDTFWGLFAAISPFAFAQIVMGTMLTMIARRSRTLVPGCATHAFFNAYVLSLRK